MMSRLTVIIIATLLLIVAPAAAIEIQSNQPSDDKAALLQQLDVSRMPPRTQGFVHIQDQKAGVLIQPDGRLFRDFHSVGQFWIDAGLICLSVLAMAALYLIVGSMNFHRDGRTIVRFSSVERFNHWLVAFCFIMLALTGLNLVFGRTLVQPWMGDDAFAEMTHLGKVAHNFLAFPFMIGLVVQAFHWLKLNLPDRTDIVWIQMAGGLFGGPHPPAKKFNAGQKMIYWATAFGGAALSLTGLALLMPFAVTDILGMQIIQVAHSLIAAGMIAIIISHIYLGTIGVRGSFEAMATGRVDLNWARDHHGLWVREEVAKGNLGPDYS